MGAGATYMTYSQDNNGADTHVQFASFKGPSWFFEARYFFSTTGAFLSAHKVRPVPRIPARRFTLRDRSTIGRSTRSRECIPKRKLDL